MLFFFFSGRSCTAVFGGVLLIGFLAVFFQASAALAKKKAKELHKDIVTFWQKKKTSKSLVTRYDNWMIRSKWWHLLCSCFLMYWGLYKDDLQSWSARGPKAWQFSLASSKLLGAQSFCECCKLLEKYKNSCPVFCLTSWLVLFLAMAVSACVGERATAV